MIRYYFTLPFLLAFYITHAQKAVVALPAMNVVYIGVDNPIQIAVEGVTNDQIKVSCDSGILSHLQGNNYILKVRNTGICNINVTYKSGDSLLTEKKQFRIKRVPIPQSMFGELESGTANISQLINQIELHGELSNFVFVAMNFTVINAEILYVHKFWDAQPISVKGNLIPIELKWLIAKSKKGDKILIDNIKAVTANGVAKRLSPIVITITNNYPVSFFNIPDYYTFQENKKSDIKTSSSPSSNDLGNMETGIIKGYRIINNDTLLIMETKNLKGKVIYERHFYESGKLQTEYNFEENDSTGAAKSFYENGMVKSYGKICKSIPSLIERYRNDLTYSELQNNSQYQIIDSFLFHNYAPLGTWKGYYENGKLALDCNFGLYNYGLIPTKENQPEYDISENNIHKKPATIKEAIGSTDCYFKSSFVGTFKLYDRQGLIIRESKF